MRTASSTLTFVLITMTAMGSLVAQETSTPAAEEATPAAVVNVEAVRAAVDAFVTAMDATIPAGDIPGFTSYLAADVFWFGSGANEAYIGRDAVLADLQAVFGPALAAGGIITVEPANRRIGVAPDGRGAWVAEDLPLTLTMGAEITVIPYRVTSLVVEDAGTWMVMAQNWSIGLPNEEALTMAAAGMLPPLGQVSANVAAGAESLIGQLQAGCADSAAWLASWSDRPDAFSYGSAPEERLESGAAIHEVFGLQIAGYQMRIAVNGDMDARLAPSGTIGFLAANLDVGFTVEGNYISQPYRALFVYLLEETGWRLVQAHFSNGMP